MWTEEERSRYNRAIQDVMEGNANELISYRYLVETIAEYPELKNHVNGIFNQVYAEFLRALKVTDPV